MTSRPRKRKPLKLGFSAHEEPTSGLVGEAVLEEQGEQDLFTTGSIWLRPN